jgi:signal transduction histidine kinase
MNYRSYMKRIESALGKIKAADKVQEIPWQGSVTVAAVPNDNEIVVSITDTGPGIDSQILPRLFTKFATKSTTGTGGSVSSYQRA